MEGSKLTRGKLATSYGRIPSKTHRANLECGVLRVELVSGIFGSVWGWGMGICDAEERSPAKPRHASYACHFTARQVWANSHASDHSIFNGHGDGRQQRQRKLG